MINQIINSNNGKITISVNGVTTVVKGRNVSINNGRIVIDGKEYNNKDVLEDDYNIQHITINGDVGEVSCDGSVSVNGAVKGIIECGGGVSIKGDVNAEIQCGGSVKIDGEHTGNINAKGSVKIEKNV